MRTGFSAAVVTALVEACLTACVAALLVGAAPVAAAVPGYQVVGVTNQPLAQGATGAVAPLCSAGKRVLGGGVYTGQDDMRLIESFPLGGNGGWLGGVFNGGGASVFDVYAICASLGAANGYEVVAVTNQPVAAGAIGAARAVCPAGKRLLGGGVYTGHDAMRLVESYPRGSGAISWYGAVFNGGGANVFDVYAICARLPTVDGYEVVAVTNQPVAAGASAAAAAACSAGKRALGGGVATGHDDMRLIESFPLGGNGGWVGGVHNGGGAGVFEVYAICAIAVP
jgi:hypothetical protein